MLAAEGLTCVVGDQGLFALLDLTVRPGDLVELRGPNGSGKSTLLRCLAGLYHPQGGRVARAAAVAYLGHKTGLCAELTALENLRWFAFLQGIRPGRAALERAMDHVGLGAARYDRCGMLSAGQQRRAALARLLVADAAVWLLDEPLTALDDAGVALVCGIIDGYRADGGAAVCATHRSLALPPAAGGSNGGGRLTQSRVVTLGP